MEKVKVITPDNLDETIVFNPDTQKWGVKVSTPTTNVTEVTKLAPSQLYVQATGDDDYFGFIELHERPAWKDKGNEGYFISELSGVQAFSMTGLGNDRIALSLREFGGVFPFNDVKIVDVSCDIYQVSDDDTSLSWNVKTPTMEKQYYVRPNGSGTEVKFVVKLSLASGELNKEYKYRIHWRVRVAERNVGV